jgi:UDP-N-acetylmuramyl tripeptide synthase
VFRDQLDRFGEIDTTQKMLSQVAKNTKKCVVLNASDPKILELSKVVKSKVVYYSMDEKLRSLFPTDSELYKRDVSQTSLANDVRDVNTASDINTANDLSDVKPNVKLLAVGGIDGEYDEDGIDYVGVTDSGDDTGDRNEVNDRESTDDVGKTTFGIGTKTYAVELSLSGIYNSYNAVAAVACALEIVGGDKRQVEHFVNVLRNVKSPFGRGEEVQQNGDKIKIILVKNPSGFRLALNTVEKNRKTLIAINDDYADGRDVSWLWDTDFSVFRNLGKNVDMTTGTRAYDMALRLSYDLVKSESQQPNIKHAIKAFKLLKGDKQIYTTYTAMLQIRKELGLGEMNE